MKKTISLVLAATIVSVVGTALLSSCEKEEINPTPTPAVQEKTVTASDHWVPAGIISSNDIDPDGIYGAVCSIGWQRSAYNLTTHRTTYYCDPGYLPCKILAESHISTYGGYKSGDVIGISVDANERPQRLYYIFDAEVANEEGLVLGDVLNLPYSLPIQDSYQLNIAPVNTVLFIPKGRHSLTHAGRAVYFSVDIDSLIARNANTIDFE